MSAPLPPSLPVPSGPEPEGHPRDSTFHAIVAALREGVVVQDQDGRITTCNAAAERILGLTREQLEGRTSLDLRWQSIHPDGTPFPGEEHPSMVTLRTGRPVTDAIMGVRRPDGRQTWISIHAQPVQFDADHRPTAVVTTFADITELCSCADQLRAHEQELEQVIEGSNDGFWDWHLPSGRMRSSPRRTAMLGYGGTGLAATAVAWRELVHPDDRALVESAIDACLRGATTSYSSEHRLHNADGGYTWVLDRGKVVERDAEGAPLRLAGAQTDISLRRTAEIRLRHALEQNERLVEDLRLALRKVKTLSGLLPVCAWCKSVRNDQGYWQQIEHYLAEHTDAQFTHGLCPDCGKRMFAGT